MIFNSFIAAKDCNFGTQMTLHTFSCHIFSLINEIFDRVCFALAETFLQKDQAVNSFCIQKLFCKKAIEFSFTVKPGEAFPSLTN